MALAELSIELSERIGQRGARMALAYRLIKIVIIPVFAVIAGISQFADFKVGSGATTIQIWGIVGTVGVGVFSFILGLAEKDSGEEMAIAFKAIEAARVAKSELEWVDRLEDELERQIDLNQSVALIRSVIERLLVVPAGTEEQLMQGLLDAGQMNLPVALNFKQGDRWTINIYKAEQSPSGKVLLRVVGTLRAIPCDLAKARTWEEGTGVVGASYSNRGEIVLPDMTKPGLKELFGTKMNVPKPDDVDVYRSMAASPIRLDGRGDLPWGVVVASNDRTDHFTTNTTARMRPDLVVKEIAGLVALAAAAHARVASVSNRTISPISQPAQGTSQPTGWLTRLIQSSFKRGS